MESANQGLTLAARNGAHRVVRCAGRQHIPWHGFPNQYVNITDNTGRYPTLPCHGELTWGDVAAAAWWQRTRPT